METKSILTLKNVSMEFPGVKALDQVNLDFRPGTVHALVGENGAGKSTMMKIIFGAYHPTSGEVVYEGRTNAIKSPKDAQDMGIYMIHQEGSLMNGMSVMENIFLRTLETNRFGFINDRSLRKKAQALLESLEVGHIDPRDRVMFLSPAERRIVEIARALAYDPKIVIMDEPTAALPIAEAEMLLRIIKQLRDRGILVIYISHVLEEVFEVSDAITVLRDGKVVDTLPASEVDISGVISMMVGRDLGDEMEKLSNQGNVKIDYNTTPVLEVESISLPGKVENVGFKLYKGEILGFAGLVGSGRTETMLSLIKYLKKSKVTGLKLDGEPAVIRHTGDAQRLGISMVPEDRRDAGIFRTMSVMDNINFANFRNLQKLCFLSGREETQTATRFCKELNVKTPHIYKRIGDLSGGNQQKAILARYMSLKVLPKVLILDEPTHGIDVGAKAEIYAIIQRLAAEGMSIILISSEMQELMLLSHRILVMYEGKKMGVVDREEFTQERIMTFASGMTEEQLAANAG